MTDAQTHTTASFDWQDPFLLEAQLSDEERLIRQFGSRKGSSYGPREQGAYAREFYTTVKTAYTAS